MRNPRFTAGLLLIATALVAILVIFTTRRSVPISEAPESVEPRNRIDIITHDNFVRSTFLEVFPILATEILNDCAITEGRALYICFVAPYLAFELSYQTKLFFDLLVPDSAVAALCSMRIDQTKLGSRFEISLGRADSLPFPDATYDIVLTRDAMRFWRNKAAVFSEIDRVLKDNGIALLGAGLGESFSNEEGDFIWSTVRKWRTESDHQPWEVTKPYPEDLEKAMVAAGIRKYRIWTEGACPCRTWVKWCKSPSIIPGCEQRLARRPATTQHDRD